LRRLADFSPDIVAIESAPGWTTFLMSTQPVVHKQTLESYVWADFEYGRKAQEILKTDWFQAISKFDDPNPTCLKNVRNYQCVLEAIAAFDLNSAFLRWQYFSDEEKQAFRSDYPEIGDRFLRMEKNANEIYVVGTALAKRLGHQRLYSVDDHREKGDLARTLDDRGLEFSTILDFWKRTESSVLDEAKKLEAEGISGKNLLNYYRFLNSDKYQAADYETQFAPMDRGEVGEAGLIFKSYWDTRMLRSASPIADILAQRPKSKMFFIVGAAHKSFLDNYFSAIPWVDVVDAEMILGAESAKD
jgi:hypothetical protein